MTLAFVLIGAASLALVFTVLLRRYAVARGLLDVPNARSLHTTPVPRGGGLAIVAAFLLGLLWLGSTGTVAWPEVWGLLGAGAAVALVGFCDDHRLIAVRHRLLAHFSAAVWVLIWMGGLPPLPVFGLVVDLGWVGDALAVVYLAWLVNLYNFMDGIDGIAGIQAMTASIGGAAITWLAAPASAGWLLPILLSAAVAGFLPWNFLRAKIFMGDAGSGFLGIILGAMSLYAAWIKPELFWAWVILLGLFIVDATVTLLARMVRGERIYESHCGHAYQHAARRLGSHQAVSLAVGLINVAWLFPLALLVALGKMDGVGGMLVAYAPLVWLVFVITGVRSESQPAEKVDKTTEKSGGGLESLCENTAPLPDGGKPTRVGISASLLRRVQR